MSRTTTSRITSAALLAGCLLAAGGCSQKYENRQLGLDSPEAKKVRALLAALRSGGEGGLDQAVRRDGAGNLTEPQARMLRETLRKLATAEKVELTRMDRYGKDVWRAIFTLVGPDGEASLPILLVIPEGGKPVWAGPSN